MAHRERAGQADALARQAHPSGNLLEGPTLHHSAADHPRPLRRALSSLAPLLAGLALQQAAASAPGVVEAVYSRRLYPWIAQALALAARPLPFSLAELAAVMGLAWLLAAAPWRRPGSRREWGRDMLGRIARGGARVLGFVFMAFLLAAGLNYQREPFATARALEVRPAGADELRALGAELLAEAAALRDGLPEDEGGALRLPQGPRHALDQVEAGFRGAAAVHPSLATPPSRPKPAWSSPLLARLGISGIFVPFTGEPHVNMTVPDVEIPFAASHEAAHQKGFLREDEANYLAALACRRHPDPAFRYSGALMAALYVSSALARADPGARSAPAAQFTAAMRRDLAALEAWRARYHGPLSDLSSRVNDVYLRSQRQPDGVRSYGRMVDLLLAERRAGGLRGVGLDPAARRR